MKKAVIYGPISFPAGDAGANRVMGIAKLFEKSGYNVLIIGNNNKISSEKLYKINEKINYTSIKSKNKLRSKLSYFFGGVDYVRAIKAWGYLDADVIMTYGGYFLGNYLAYPQLSKNSKLIVDIVEWYSKLQKKNLGLIKYYNNQIALRYYYKKYNNKIVISDYLHSYFKNSFVLPPIINVEDYPFKKTTSDDEIKIVYAGKNQGKDDLINFIEAFKSLSPRVRNRFKVSFYGVDKNNFLKVLDNQSKFFLLENKRLFSFHNRINHATLLNKISEADFTLLFRSKERYAMAGFPSKVPESLACGTPILCNYTSDLNKYITDEYDSMICSSNSVDDIALKLDEISTLCKNNRNKMKENARKTAEINFSVENWHNKFDLFLENLN